MNVKALITLLDDPDELIFESVSEQIRNLGPEVVHDLEIAWETTLDESLRERIEELIHTIQFNHTKNSLRDWHQSDKPDLLTGVWLVCRYHFPELEIAELLSKIEQIRYDVWLELKDNFTALEKVKVLNHVLFELHKFSGNIKNYYASHNSYLNQVLENKQGNPISLAIIYSLIAQKLDIPIYGVNLPKNFVLAYLFDGTTDQPEKISEDEVMFYINPFNRGQVFNRKEIEVYLKSQKIKPDRHFYIPCDNRQIIRRVLQNLHFSYQQAGLEDKAKEISELKEQLED